MRHRTKAQGGESSGQRQTWAALLAHWVGLAKSAVALPADAEGRRLRAAVPDVIMLQAVWHALQHLSELSADERGLGLDRAALLLGKHEAALRERFAGSLPEPLRDLVQHVRSALAAHEQG